MTSMPEVIARLRAALTGLRPDELREIHHHLTDNLQPLLTQLATETTNPDLAATPELLANALTAIGNAADLYDHATHLTHSYIADHDTEPAISVAATGRTTESAPPHEKAAPAQPGRWKGKTATEHARTNGEDIGRKAPGSKKYATREVRSVAELDEIFMELSRSGEKIDLPHLQGGR
ncbi:MULTISPECIES: hypothetical protein [Actinoalloteichus]|uniref:Uncharacterized protein n=1 Tax=Actinoalloteichus fjordicus TaxID=1612552 RepID=A0AAC9LHC5_9PSEU|nr:MULTISPECIES: hypothetical protein [Actinoalloteichus]APU17716.1 hypothetical protein UA74_28585 [Actinoalloteichus fjordicus]APU23794.1 hypothetical protein UA75_29115 [Actinoalloteichus sp. GBA129-24]